MRLSGWVLHNCLCACLLQRSIIFDHDVGGVSYCFRRHLNIPCSKEDPREAIYLFPDGFALRRPSLWYCLEPPGPEQYPKVKYLRTYGSENRRSCPASLVEGYDSSQLLSMIREYLYLFTWHTIQTAWYQNSVWLNVTICKLKVAK